MPWLRNSDDEVTRFHTEFESASRVALEDLRLAERYVWTHHVRVQGETLIPDFVLMERTSGRWIVAFELKRTRESVYSTRFQIQAKGYADLNQDKFPLTASEVFCYFKSRNHTAFRSARRPAAAGMSNRRRIFRFRAVLAGNRSSTQAKVY